MALHKGEMPYTKTLFMINYKSSVVGRGVYLWPDKRLPYFY